MGLKVESSKSDFKLFVKSSIWIDIVQTLKDRIDLTRDQLETCFDYDEIRRLQGKIEELRYFLLLPDGIVQELTETKGNSDVD